MHGPEERDHVPGPGADVPHQAGQHGPPSAEHHENPGAARVLAQGNCQDKVAGCQNGNKPADGTALPGVIVGGQGIEKPDTATAASRIKHFWQIIYARNSLEESAACASCRPAPTGDAAQQKSHQSW